MRSIQFDRFGGPEVLRLETLEPPRPRDHEIVVAMEAIGVNFADIYRRRGSYRREALGAPPWNLGYEGAGVVSRVGAGVGDFELGDRVAFVDGEGALAEQVALAAEKAIRLPAQIDAELATAALLQGMTASYLLELVGDPGAVDTVVVHAAGGGTGLCLTQLAAAAGARVLGFASSAAKRSAALAAGAERALPLEPDWPLAVQRWSGGGADLVFDSLGTTLALSIEAVRTGGTVVFFGMSAGDPPPVDAYALLDGSKTVTGGDLWNGCRTAAERQRRADSVFAAIETGVIRPTIARRFPLERAADAYTELEGRAIVGKILLTVMDQES